MNKRNPVAGTRPRQRTIVLILGSLFASVGAADSGGDKALLDAWWRVPITFERNEGQLRPEILFAARGVSGEIAIRSGELCVLPSSTPPTRRPERRPNACDADSPGLRVRFAGANAAPEVEPRGLLETRSHYYRGRDRRENIPHFGEVVLRDVYPQIDVAFHGKQGQLEYDFIVAPGANPRNIRLDLSSVHEASVDAAGNLVMRLADRSLVQRAPVAYQELDGTRVPVPASFALREGEAGAEAYFVLGDYDASRELVIDPVLSFSSYLGGSASDFGGYVQSDLAGRVYIAYVTAPIGGSLGSSGSGVNVTKIDPATSSVIYTTTLSGSSYNVVQALALEHLGSSGANAYITGYTASDDFPTCLGTKDCADFGGGEDAFVTAIGSSGGVMFSTFLGGSGDDAATGVAIGSSGSIHVVGTTDSHDFPTTVTALFPDRLGSSAAGDLSDVFVTRMTVAAGITYSTYLGGTDTDVGSAIAVDSSGNMYVTGQTQSSDFPRVLASPTTAPAMFVTKIGASGGPINFSTLIGGSGDVAHGIALDLGRKVFVTGDTARSNFTIVNSVRTYQGGRDVFLTRLGSSGGPTEFSTLVGGSGDDFAGGIALGASGDVFLAGTTRSDDFPVISAIQSAQPGPTSAFLARFRNDVLDFSTYLGGSGDDYGNSVAFGPLGEVYVAGRATSPDFPTVNPYRSVRSGDSDAFVSKVMFPPSVPRFLSAVRGDGQVQISWSPPATNGGGSTTVYQLSCEPGGIIIPFATSPQLVTGLTNGVTYTCSVIATNTIGSSEAASIQVIPAVPPTLASVVSRKSHGGAGDHNLPIDATQPISGPITIEPRLIGSGHQVVFTFSGTVSSPGSVSCQDGATNGFLGCFGTASGNSVVVNVLSVGNSKRVKITLTNVNGQMLTVTASVGFLPGDLDSSRGVTATDVLIAKGRSGQTVDGSTFKYDVDKTGDLGELDILAVKSGTGTEIQ